MISIVWKIIIASVILIETMAVAFLGWRVLNLIKRVKDTQADRNAIDEERRKQSDQLRVKGLEIDRLREEKLILTLLEKTLIFNALKMGEFKDWIEDPKTPYQTRGIYKQLKEKVKENIKE